MFILSGPGFEPEELLVIFKPGIEQLEAWLSRAVCNKCSLKWGCASSLALRNVPDKGRQRWAPAVNSFGHRRSFAARCAPGTCVSGLRAGGCRGPLGSPSSAQIHPPSHVPTVVPASSLVGFRKSRMERRCGKVRGEGSWGHPGGLS